MDYENIGSNANHQYTKEVEENKETKPKRAEALVSGSVSPRKKSLDRRIFDIMFPGTLEDMKDHMVFDVLIPRIRDGIWDMLSDGLAILFTGSTRRKSDNRGVTAKVQYGDYYDRRRPEPTRSRRDDPPDPRDIGFDFEDQAKQIRDDLIEYISRYDQVPLAYFYDRCGITSDNWQGPNNYGWTELGTADIVTGRDEDGRRKWYINFPRPKYLK